MNWAGRGYVRERTTRLQSIRGLYSCVIFSRRLPSQNKGNNLHGHRRNPYPIYADWYSTQHHPCKSYLAPYSSIVNSTWMLHHEVHIFLTCQEDFCSRFRSFQVPRHLTPLHNHPSHADPNSKPTLDIKPQIYEISQARPLSSLLSYIELRWIHDLMNLFQICSLCLQSQIRFRDEKGPKSSKNNHQDAACCSNHEVKDKRVAQAGNCCEGNHCSWQNEQTWEYNDGKNVNWEKENKRGVDVAWESTKELAG